jgi:hypothetical protein
MSKGMNHYWEEPFARTLQTIKDCAKKQHLSCAHMPLLDITLENVVLDELHLMLRITGMHALFCSILWGGGESISLNGIKNISPIINLINSVTMGEGIPFLLTNSFA